MDHGIHCLGLPCPDSYQPPDLPSTIKYWEKTKETGRYDPFMLCPTQETCVAQVGSAIGENQHTYCSTNTNASRGCKPFSRSRRRIVPTRTAEPVRLQVPELVPRMARRHLRVHSRHRHHVLFYLWPGGCQLSSRTGSPRRKHVHRTQGLSMYPAEWQHISGEGSVSSLMLTASENL